MLRSGGNVVDAAVGAALVQTAVDPQGCGIAGFGSMHIFDGGVHKVLDFHGRAPLAAKPDMWEDLIVRECDDGFGFILKGEVNEIGYQSATTPMTLRAFDDALKGFGTRSLSDLLAPAIEFCENGFVVTPHVHAFWMRGPLHGRIPRIRGLTECPATAKIYTKSDGSIFNVGETLKNPDMGKTLRRIAKNGVDDFYSGEIAGEIVADMNANGGLVSARDLADCASELNDPIWTQYRGHRIATNPLPGGGLVILEMLNILEHFDLASMGHNSPEFIATVSEGMKIATIDKDALLGDPRFIDIPIQQLLSKPYAAEKAAQIRSGHKANVSRLNAGATESPDTTHICVADTKGNCVSLTHSLGSSSGVVTEGLGFMYNNCMMVFDPRPRHAGSLAPGKARMSSISPTIVFRGDDPCFLLGAPGGTTITMGNLQAIINMIDFGMTAQEAVFAPRFITTSNTIELTNRTLRSTEHRLRDMGYPTIRHAQSYMPPKVHAIRIGADGNLDGGADPAGGGLAVGI